MKEIQPADERLSHSHDPIFYCCVYSVKKKKKSACQQKKVSCVHNTTSMRGDRKIKLFDISKKLESFKEWSKSYQHYFLSTSKSTQRSLVMYIPLFEYDHGAFSKKPFILQSFVLFLKIKLNSKNCIKSQL